MLGSAYFENQKGFDLT